MSVDKVSSSLKLDSINLNAELEPSLSNFAITFRSRFALLICCNGENAVQGGDPTTQNGFTSRASLMTLD